jgi:hypothetical protein
VSGNVEAFTGVVTYKFRCGKTSVELFHVVYEDGDEEDMEEEELLEFLDGQAAQPAPMELAAVMAALVEPTASKMNRAQKCAFWFRRYQVGHAGGCHDKQLILSDNCLLKMPSTSIAKVVRLDGKDADLLLAHGKEAHATILDFPIPENFSVHTPKEVQKASPGALVNSGAVGKSRKKQHAPGFKSHATKTLRMSSEENAARNDMRYGTRSNTPAPTRDREALRSIMAKHQPNARATPLPQYMHGKTRDGTDNGMTSRVVGAQAVSSATAALAEHRDKRGGLVIPSSMPSAVSVKTWYYKVDPETRLLVECTEGPADGDLIGVWFRGATKEEDFQIFPRHKSVYIMSGAFNAYFTHALQCTVTVDGLVRVSRILHEWY